MDFHHHGQHRTITAAVSLRTRLLAPLSGIGCIGLAQCFGSGGLLTLLPIEALVEIAYLRFKRFHLRLQGCFTLHQARVLGSPVVCLPLKCDIVLLCQHHCLFGEGRRLRAAHRCTGRSGDGLWLSLFHKLMLYQLFWKSPVFLMGAMGWPNIYGKRNPNYWDKGKPYLDGYRALFISDTAARVAALKGERAHIEFRGLAPKQRDEIVKALGAKATVQESPWDCILLVTMNHEKKPFDDPRVRRALTLALDRYEGSRVLSQIAIVKEVAGVQVPGTPYATPPEALAGLAGYGTKIEASRREARRLLKEAGAEGLSFTFKNRGIPMPYEPLGIWLIDQWRKIGVNVNQEVIEAAAYYKVLRAGEHEAAMDFQCGYIVDPDLDLYKFLSVDRNPSNYSRYSDRDRKSTRL